MEKFLNKISEFKTNMVMCVEIPHRMPVKVFMAYKDEPWDTHDLNSSMEFETVDEAIKNTDDFKGHQGIERACEVECYLISAGYCERATFDGEQN